MLRAASTVRCGFGAAGIQQLVALGCSAPFTAACVSRLSAAAHVYAYSSGGTRRVHSTTVIRRYEQSELSPQAAEQEEAEKQRFAAARPQSQGTIPPSSRAEQSKTHSSRKWVNETNIEWVVSRNKISLLLTLLLFP